jgi:hypothetical protein
MVNLFLIFKLSHRFFVSSILSIILLLLSSSSQQPTPATILVILRQSLYSTLVALNLPISPRDKAGRLRRPRVVLNSRTLTYPRMIGLNMIRKIKYLLVFMNFNRNLLN